MLQGNIAVTSQVSEDEPCRIREVLDRVGDKWSVQVLRRLTGGPHRFADLQRTIEGISKRMLALTLRRLERDGLVTRTVYPTVPPKVEYAVTPIAAELKQPLEFLAEWADRHRIAITKARKEFDRRQTASEPVSGI